MGDDPELDGCGMNGMEMEKSTGIVSSMWLLGKIPIWRAEIVATPELTRSA